MGSRGEESKPIFDLEDPMGLSSCVACGECVQACPTGALMEKSLLNSNSTKREIYPDKVVDSCLLYTSPSPRDATLSRMPSSA